MIFDDRDLMPCRKLQQFATRRQRHGRSRRILKIGSQYDELDAIAARVASSASTSIPSASRGWHCRKDENLLITDGCQQALDQSAKRLCGPVIA